MCQLLVSKDFETSLLTLLGVSLVLWRRKADNVPSNPPRPLVHNICISNFQLLHFLKFLVGSRHDWEKKCREGSRQGRCLVPEAVIGSEEDSLEDVPVLLLPLSSCIA
jgi:hypothetical protein